MTVIHDGPRGATVSPRAALLSILCFWLVYFTVATVRSFMIDWGHQTEMMAARAFVTVGSMVATYIVYLAMRPLARKSIVVNVSAVALLSIPAAVAYSSMNWMAFQQVDKKIMAEKESRKYRVDDRSVAQARDQARIAIAAARDAIRDATEQAKAAGEAKAEAQREAAAAQREIARRNAEAQKIKSESQSDAAQDRAAALREAEQDRRDAIQDAYQLRREVYLAQREAYREANDSYKESLQEARAAVEEAKQQGVHIDINELMSSIPPPPTPPAPPVPAYSAARPEAPRSAPAAPPATAPVTFTKRKIVTISPPMTADIPTPIITEPTPGTVMIQVGQPADPHKEKDLSIVAQIGDQALNGYFFFAAWGALFLALSYAAAVRAAEREAAAYRAAARDAELRALRYQVNPHFLFNTLNSLSTLILKNRPDDAEAMILNLSTFFRTSLTADPTEDVMLSEEIRLQRLYLDIEAVRFPDRLVVEFNIPSALNDVCVPCLILQPLVENAIKYGVSRAKQPVTIRISAWQDSHGLVLSVEDDGELLPENGKNLGTGVGLKNVTDRLNARFGSEASCRYGPLPNRGFGVTIFMPLIRNGV